MGSSNKNKKRGRASQQTALGRKKYQPRVSTPTPEPAPAPTPTPTPSARAVPFPSCLCLPSRLVVIAGTYDGAVVGFDTDPSHAAPTPQNPPRRRDLASSSSSFSDDDSSSSNPSSGRRLRLSFAMPVHDGSVRSLVVTSRSPSEPGTLTTAGHDGSLHVYSLPARREIGESRPPSSAAMPSAGACACPPPPSTRTTHLCLGTEDGKIWILDAGTYLAAETKPLAGHVGPVEAVICHPSGAAALSAARGRGRRDGTVRLWDLTRGKAAHVHRITGTKADASDVRWSPDGKRWGYCAGSLVRAFDAEKGDVPTLDVDLGTKVNALCFVQGGSILAAGCEDGSLAVLAVGDVEEGEEGVVRGVMALYPKVETGKTAGNDRIKKVLPATFSERERRIVTVTSSGRVTVWDLTRPINRVLGLDGDAKEERGRDDGDANNSEEEDDEEEDLAVLIQEVLVGSDGTRVTDMVVWGRDDVNEEDPPPTNAGNPADAKAAAPNEHERDSKKESTNVDSCDGVSETERDIAPMAAPLASAVQVKEEKEGGWKTRGPYDSNKKPQEDGRVLADDLDDLKKEGAPLLLQKKKQKEKKGKKKKKGKDGSGKVKSV